MPYPKASYDVLILESHLDTFGHVNNAAYLTLFEESRWDFITKNGYGLKEGPGTPARSRCSGTKYEIH